MFAAVTPILTLLATAAKFAHADPNPTSPGPGDVFIQGKSCTISWDIDSTGIWKNMNIALMTGNNFDMIVLTTVASSIDATDASKNTFSYTCPQVSPYSAVYFYQFSSPTTTVKTWTGRFAITDSANDIVAPSQSTQPDGSNIPWGVGTLVNGSSSAIPSFSGTATIANVTASTSTSSTSSGLSTSSSSTTTKSNVGTVTSAVSATTSSISSNANGVMGTLAVPNVFQTGFAFGLAALGFGAMF